MIFCLQERAGNALRALGTKEHSCLIQTHPISVNSVVHTMRLLRTIIIGATTGIVLLGLIGALIGIVAAGIASAPSLGNSDLVNRTAVKGASYGVTIGLVAGSIFGLFLGVINPAMRGWAVGLVIGLALGIIFGFLGVPQVNKVTFFSRDAIILRLGSGLVLGLIGSIIGWLIGALADPILSTFRAER